MSLEIRVQADDFLMAYTVLKENYDSKTLAILGPSIVCLAFATELYLKDLLTLLKKSPKRSHIIFDLFLELPSETQKEIFDHKSISKNPFMTKGCMLSPRYFSKEYTEFERFIDQMKGISDAFKEWRYSYEHGTLTYDSSFALALIESVKTVADKIRNQQIMAEKVVQ
jgi:HEPN domain-containing protein